MSMSQEVRCQISDVRRRSSGFTRVELAVSAGLILLIGTAMILGARYARRVSRDVERLSAVRQAQADLEGYRLKRLAYPAAGDPDAPEGFDYRPTPDGCAPATDNPCLGYEIAFVLEGRIGGLAGGACTATREATTCVAAK